MRVFISQPMKDKTNEEIKKERREIEALVEQKYENGNIEFVDSFFVNVPHDAKPLYYLGKALCLLSTVDLCVFAKDYKNYRGCKIEKLCCDEYGIETLEI